MENQPVTPGTELPADAPLGEPVLHVEQLVKVYPGSAAPAVNGLGFSVHPGEIFGLLGPNGAGKTTAISIICTLLRQTSGKVVICSRDTAQNSSGVRGLFGLAPQDIALYPSLSARENLKYFGKLYGLRGRQLEGRVEACLSLVGLLENADMRTEAFSGGMKRRANLAAAILHTPQLLILDEPTVGIDAQSRNMILENLKKLRDSGMTIIYTTHYMEEAEQICDRVAVMDKGSIIALGPPRELIAATPGCKSLEDVFLHLTGKQLRD